MKIIYNITCKKCGSQFRMVFDSSAGAGGTFETDYCPGCGKAIASQTIERLYDISDRIVASHQIPSQVELSSIVLDDSPTDPARPTAQQSEREFQKRRLKEIEAQAQGRD